MDRQRVISMYLNHHLAGANAGVHLFRRATSAMRSTAYVDELADLTAQVEQDRAELRRVMGLLDVRENVPFTFLGSVAERVGRLKPNGAVVSRSPLSDLVEVEALRGAVLFKKHGWEALATLADRDPRISRDELLALAERAGQQAERLDRIHLQVAGGVLAEV